MSALTPLLGGERTQLGHRGIDASDPLLTFKSVECSQARLLVKNLGQKVNEAE
jgi:hypothetical protein